MGCNWYVYGTYKHVNWPYVIWDFYIRIGYRLKKLHILFVHWFAIVELYVPWQVDFEMVVLSFGLSANDIHLWLDLNLTLRSQFYSKVKKNFTKKIPQEISIKCAKYGLDNLRGLGGIRVISGVAADAARFTPNTYKWPLTGIT